METRTGRETTVARAIACERARTNIGELSELPTENEHRTAIKASRAEDGRDCMEFNVFTKRGSGPWQGKHCHGLPYDETPSPKEWTALGVAIRKVRRGQNPEG